MTASRATVTAQVTFTRPADVYPDPVRTGLLRAKTQPNDMPYKNAFDLRDCKLQDWSTPGSPQLGIQSLGFDVINLGKLSSLQALLETVRQNSRVEDDQAQAIREHLNGQSFKLSDGKRLKILTLGEEGFIMRRAGLNGSIVAPDEQMTQMNGHDGALAVHADQDAMGTPLKQALKGWGHRLFRHESPYGKNNWSPLLMMNLWIPLQQISRPLTFMDTSTLDRKLHQLCYALPTGDFLDRDPELSMNDTWSFLWDEKQRWYFNADLNASQAYVFDTLSTPHAAFILPGEVTAEQLHNQLKKAQKAAKADDIATLAKVCAPLKLDPLPAETTAPLRNAVTAMETLLGQARSACKSQQLPPQEWLAVADSTLDSLVRKSLEMRGVGLLTRDIWPLNKL